MAVEMLDCQTFYNKLSFNFVRKKLWGKNAINLNPKNASSNCGFHNSKKASDNMKREQKGPT